MTDESGQRPPPEKTTAAQRQRLAPVLATLKSHRQSVLLDLCEMLLMVAEEVGEGGMFRWDHPRILVHIRSESRAIHPREKRSGASYRKARAAKKKASGG